MKRSYSTLLFFFVTAFIFSSCSKALKNVEDYYPVVNTVSATVLQNGNVEVKGQIVSEGASPIEYAGFCMGESPSPGMLSNQMISSDIQGNEFTATYAGFDPYKRYYFRSWATNDNGYSYGNTIYLDSIQATPVVAPCTLAANTINIGGSQPTETYSSVQAPSQSMSEWAFQAYSNSTSVNFTFGSQLTTGVFTTTTNSSPAPGEVFIGFYSGFISSALNNGSSVYVNQLTPSSWEITICNAPWNYNSSTFYFNTRFTCPS